MGLVGNKVKDSDKLSPVEAETGAELLKKALSFVLIFESNVNKYFSGNMKPCDKWGIFYEQTDRQTE